MYKTLRIHRQGKFTFFHVPHQGLLKDWNQVCRPEKSFLTVQAWDLRKAGSPNQILPPLSPIRKRREAGSMGGEGKKILLSSEHGWRHTAAGGKRKVEKGRWKSLSSPIRDYIMLRAMWEHLEGPSPLRIRQSQIKIMPLLPLPSRWASKE